MTSIHWSPVVTVLKIFLKMLLIALKYHIMFRLKAHVLCCRFLFKNKPVVRNVYGILCIVGFEGTEIPENLVVNFRHFSYDFFHL